MSRQLKNEIIMYLQTVQQQINQIAKLSLPHQHKYICLQLLTTARCMQQQPWEPTHVCSSTLYTICCHELQPCHEMSKVTVHDQHTYNQLCEQEKYILKVQHHSLPPTRPFCQAIAIVGADSPSPYTP